MKKHPKIIAYTGFGTPEKVFLSGSVVLEKNHRQSRESDSEWRNARRMIQRFFLKPVACAEIAVETGKYKTCATTDEKGYFETRIHFEEKLPAGWHSAIYSFISAKGEKIVSEGKFIIIGETSKRGIISDIDDTIVKSYSFHAFKKLWTLLSKNDKTRKLTPFARGFYNRLHSPVNPFFYVSSSERNLYSFWKQILDERGFPPGPVILTEMKYGIVDLLTGGKVHFNHKYEKIAGLFNLYQHMNFILIGDNGQKDVEIYAKLAVDFPGRIQSVYIVRARNKSVDKSYIQLFESNHIGLVIAKNLEEAVIHASSAGFV